MKFNLVDEIAYPRGQVFETHRDRLEDLVPYFPNVESVVVESRKEEGHLIHLVNRWSGDKGDVPALIRPLLKPETLVWIDRATWDASRWRCDWSTTLVALPDVMEAKGFNIFQEEGSETVIHMTGEFKIQPANVPGVPTFVAKRAGPTLERFIIGLLQPNLKQSNRAVERWLDDNL